MLNVKTILFGLSIFAAGFAPATPSFAASSPASVYQSSHTENAIEDFNDWFDGLSDKEQDVIAGCFDQLIDKLADFDSKSTLRDFHMTYRSLAKALVSKLGTKKAKNLFSNDLMEPVYLAATINNSADWIDAVIDTDLGVGNDNDLQAWSDGEALGGLAGGIIGGIGAAATIGGCVLAGVALGPAFGVAAAAATMVGAGALVGTMVGSLLEGDNDGDGEVDTDQQKIEELG
jgi:hypothetical protein